MRASDAETGSEGQKAQAAAELQRAAELRRRADWELSMPERLARVQELCKQVSAIKGAAQRR